MTLLICIGMIVWTIWFCSTHPTKPVREQFMDMDAQAKAKTEGKNYYIGTRGETRATKNGHVAAYRPMKDENGKVIGRELCDVSKHGLPGAPVIAREPGNTHII